MTTVQQPPARLVPREIGTSPTRVEGAEKVTGTAAYAYEHRVPEPAYLFAVLSTVPRGEITGIDTTRAERVPGVLAVLTPDNAYRLDDTTDRELAVLQSREVSFRGQLVAGVVADTSEAAREAAGLVQVTYRQQPFDTRLRTDHPDLYTPDQVNGGQVPDTRQGEVETALALADAVVDRTYRTPMEHNVPMEPHTTVARWDDSGSPTLVLHDSTQSVHGVRQTLAALFGLSPDRVRVIAPHIGGGFGSKGIAHAHTVFAALAARHVPGRSVKLALTRQQSFPLTGHRSPTIQRVRLGATRDGRLLAADHQAYLHTSRIKEFVEQAAVPSRVMYAAANRHTSHRAVPLDIPVPSWMRAPGEEPGSVALEVAMDELAEALGMDPIELRIRNEPERDPESGDPWSGRHLVECLRRGAERFGWDRRPVVPGARRDGDWLVGLGVAASTYPVFTIPGSRAAIRFDGDGYTVRIGAVDIGTGTRTALQQIAADALGCPYGLVRVEIGDTRLPPATVEGGSSGIGSWGSTIVGAARTFRSRFGERPAVGDEVVGQMSPHPDRKGYALHSFGAQFVEARVHADTGEVRVPRMLGVFSCGRIINPRTARSQFIGGMIMGLSAALFEEGVLDHGTGHVVNHDLAGYHIATSADIGDIDAEWLDEPDYRANPMGSKGIGEIGIVGAAAAVANATYNATGVRVRALPLTPDHFCR